MRNTKILLLYLLCLLWGGLLEGCGHLPRAYQTDRSGLMDGLRSAGANLGRGGSQVSLSKIRPITKEWKWPLKKVSVTSQFGSREGRQHDGIDLKASSGTPVFSVQSGRVIYAGNGISGYGKLIVIKHPSGLSSLYAHNSKILVKKGHRVIKGQKISLSGKTGRASGPHLHFEIRAGTIPVNPKKVMPHKG